MTPHHQPQAERYGLTNPSPRTLGIAGGLLFFLGLAAAFLAMHSSFGEKQAHLILSAAVLLSLGYPALLHVRALQRIITLERQVAALTTPLDRASTTQPAVEVEDH